MSLSNAPENLYKESDRSRFETQTLSLAQIETSSVEEVPLELPDVDEIEEQSGPIHSFLEHVMTYSFPVLWVADLYLAVDALSAQGLLWAILIAVPLTWILADLLTGTLHWFADTYGSEDTPVLGRLIKPFRLHHIFPRAICRHDLVLTIGNSCLLAVPVLGILLYSMVVEAEVSGAKAFAALSLTLTAFAAVATNIFHRWAHAEETNRPIRVLQGSRLILTKDHHQLHHSRPFDSNYCITVGWLNPLLEKLGFFRKLEWLLGGLGLRPADSCTEERTATNGAPSTSRLTSTYSVDNTWHTRSERISSPKLQVPEERANS